MVRTPACHAGGRGFEPHPGRHFAALAQQAEHFLGKEEVGSSNLLGSSTSEWTLLHSDFSFKKNQSCALSFLLFAKGHVRAGYSLASALITPLAYYQPFAAKYMLQISLQFDFLKGKYESACRFLLFHYSLFPKKLADFKVKCNSEKGRSEV